MEFKLQRKCYELPDLIFTWVFVFISWKFVYELTGGMILFQRISVDSLIGPLSFLLLLLLCAFLRYRPTQVAKISSEDALTLCVILVFRQNIAVAILSTSAMLITISQLANQKIYPFNKFSYWIASLGEIAFQGGLMGFVTVIGSITVRLFYKILYNDPTKSLTSLGTQEILSIPCVYLTIVIIRWSILFVHSWMQGMSFLEFMRNLKQLRSFSLFISEVVTILTGTVMAVAYIQKNISIFVVLGCTLLVMILLLNKQASVAEALQSTIVELKILTGVGRILANASQTRRELLSILYTQGIELFGADSLALYLCTENNRVNTTPCLYLEGADIRKKMSLARRQDDHLKQSNGSTSKENIKNVVYRDELPEESTIVLAEWCIRNNRVLQFDNIKSEAPLYGYGKLAKYLPYSSWLGVPLEIENRLIGVISIASESRAAFTEHHRELLIALGQQVASALENARLFEIAMIDSLTELFTMRHLHQKLVREFDHAKSTKEPLSVIMIDIDHFKKINDTYGHEVGNEVLKYLAILIRECLRSFDVAARYGGEEFIIILPHTSLSSSEQVAKRLCKTVEESFADTSTGKINITISLGVSCYPNANILDTDGLIKAADKALYQSKQNGRNQVVTC